MLGGRRWARSPGLHCAGGWLCPGCLAQPDYRATTEIVPGTALRSVRNLNSEFNFSEHSLQEEYYSTSKTSVDCLILHKTQEEEKWVAPILDHTLQDQSLDHNLVLDQDQDHTRERRDTVLGLVPGHIQDLVVEIVCILEITAEITEIIEE